jgi:hypothetical protein
MVQPRVAAIELLSIRPRRAGCPAGHPVMRS